MKAVVFRGIGDIRLATTTSSRSACKAVDTRQPGWLKVELLPGEHARGVH